MPTSTKYSLQKPCSCYWNKPRQNPIQLLCPHCLNKLCPHPLYTAYTNHTHITTTITTTTTTTTAAITTNLVVVPVIATTDQSCYDLSSTALTQLMGLMTCVIHKRLNVRLYHFQNNLVICLEHRLSTTTITCITTTTTQCANSRLPELRHHMP